MGDKGVLVISKTLAGVFALTIVALFVGEGLLIGLLNKEECPTTTVTLPPTPDTTTTKPSAKTTTQLPDLGPWTSYRLPTSLTPISYTVDLKPVFELKDGTYWFYGSSTVEFTCDEATEYILINSRDIEYDENWILSDAISGNIVEFKQQFSYEPNEYIVFELNSPCKKGNRYTLEAPSFHGELSTSLNGFYRSEYVNQAGVSRVIATSQMETTGARQTFPCFDEPAFKAVFNIILRSPDGYIAVSNMPVKDIEVVVEDGVNINKNIFEESVIMSTYLLAVTVTDFENIKTNSTKGVETGIYARASLIENGEMDFTSIVSPQIIDVYDDFFNVFYPLQKSDQMCVPDFDAGAMENWGLVIYREVYLVYDPIISSPNDKYSVTSVIAHELAHQWFGNLITCSYWSEIWLNEGFATYFSYVGVDGVKSDWKSWEQFVIDDLQRALSSDSYSSSHPLVHPEGYFSAISYSKGASFLQMTNDFLGESTFTTAITNYLNEFQYSIVSHDDLFAAFIDQAKNDGKKFPYDLQAVFETWSLQMGYPLITVRKTGDKIYMSQEYFLVDPDDSPVKTEFSDIYNYKWYVPITYKLDFSATDREISWMDLDDDLSLDATGQNKILVNVNAKGFYRVLYEGDLWSQIKTSVKANLQQFTPQNRAMFLDDAFEISKSGKIAIEEVFEISSYLNNEHSYIAWDTFYSGIDYYDKMLASAEVYGDFTKWVLSLAEPGLYTYYGWDDLTDQDDDSYLVDRQTRGIAIDITCFYKNEDCIKTAQQRYQNWMVDETQIISNQYRSDVYCTAIRAGGVNEWDYAWEQYLKSNSAQHQSSLRYGMSCSEEPWIINRYIERVMNKNYVRLQDQSSTLSYIGRHESSKYIAWAFAVNNYDRLTNALAFVKLLLS